MRTQSFVDRVNIAVAQPIDKWLDRLALKWTYRHLDESTQKSFGDLVDIIFAVIIAESFVIFIPGHAAPSPVQYFVLAISYATVVVSWVFYHISKSRNDYRTFSRFIVDLAILFTYWVLVAYISSPVYVVWADTAMLWLYIVWGVLKIAEYRNTVLRYLFRIPFPVIATLIALEYSRLAGALWSLPFWPFHHQQNIAEGCIIAITAVVVFMYRIEVKPSGELAKTEPRQWGLLPPHGLDSSPPVTSQCG
jgi:hypothetical protein